MKAKESVKVKKARHKLESQMRKEREQVTPQALTRVMQEMRQWIHRHGQDRINLKKKSFALFDENQHSAKVTSQYVRHLYSHLNEEKPNERVSQKEMQGAELRGRITQER